MKTQNFLKRAIHVPFPPHHEALPVVVEAVERLTQSPLKLVRLGALKGESRAVVFFKLNLKGTFEICSLVHHSQKLTFQFNLLTSRN